MGKKKAPAESSDDDVDEDPCEFRQGNSTQAELVSSEHKLVSSEHVFSCTSGLKIPAKPHREKW